MLVRKYPRCDFDPAPGPHPPPPLPLFFFIRNPVSPLKKRTKSYIFFLHVLYFYAQVWQVQHSELNIRDHVNDRLLYTSTRIHFFTVTTKTK